MNAEAATGKAAAPTHLAPVAKQPAPKARPATAGAKKDRSPGPTAERLPMPYFYEAYQG